MKIVKFDKLTGEQLKQLLEQKATGGEVNTVPELMALFEGIPDDTTLEDWVAQQIDTSPDMENLRTAMAELAAMEEEINGHEQQRISQEGQREEQAGSDHQRAEQDHSRAEEDHGTAESDHGNEQQRIENEQERQQAEHQRAETFAGYEQRITTMEGEVSDVTDLIPSQASDSNQLADKAFVNSSVATAAATFRGTYNLVSDLSLTTSATVAQTETALATKMAALSIVADNNDYAYVQIPTADATPTEIARIDRYKFNGTAWSFEYSLNNSGFTAAQWAAINSGITSAKVAKLDALPTNADLTADFAEVNAKITALSSGVKVSLAVSPTVIYKGESQSFTLTGTMANGTPTSMTIFDGSTVLKTTDATPTSHTISGLTLTDNSKTYRLEGVTLGMTLQATVAVSARYPIYYGFGATASDVKVAANKYAATTSANHTYEKTLAAGSANKYFYLLVPTDITAPAVGDFTMNKSPFVVTKNPSGDTVTGYNVYRSANQYAAGTTIKATVG